MIQEQQPVIEVMDNFNGKEKCKKCGRKLMITINYTNVYCWHCLEEIWYELGKTDKSSLKIFRENQPRDLEEW